MNWNNVLKQGLHVYKNPDKTKKDIQNCLTQYQGLAAKFENFVFNDGSEKKLLCLDGVIPVNFKGSRYNIPIVIWLLDTHPYNPPICYVKPTYYMDIKVSQHVDQSGKIYLPYLHDWKPGSFDLLGLIQVMVIVFGATCPVYMKGPNQTASPPYPTGYPGARPSITPQTQPVGMFGTQQPLFPSPVPPISGNFPSFGSAYPQQTPPTYPPPQYSQQSVSSTGTISDEHIRASLMSAVEDKMKKKLREMRAQTIAEMEVLRRTQQDLTKNREKLDGIINKFENQKVELEKAIVTLTEKDEELDEALSKADKEEGVEVDEAVLPVAPLYKQILNAYAAENSTQDAIYYLTDGLRAGVLDLDSYLKHVRSLSRQQFILRATMIKCRQSAKLAC